MPFGLCAYSPIVLNTEAPGPAPWGLQSLGKLCLSGSDTDHIISKVSMSGPIWVSGFSPVAPSSDTCYPCCLFSRILEFLYPTPLLYWLLSYQKYNQPSPLTSSLHIQFSLDTALVSYHILPGKDRILQLCLCFQPLCALKGKSSIENTEPFS